jgi:hypothetical protein
MWRKSLLVVLGLVSLYSVLLPAVAAQTTGSLNLDRIRRATVFIMQIRSNDGQPIITCIGSGTIVDRSGLIATNAHFTVPNRNCQGDSLIVALTARPDEPPIPTYRAEVVQANVGLDLALLRLTRELDGRAVDPGSLSLPFVELGESSQVNLDDTITVVGYPSIGGEPVEEQRGTVGGFIAEPSGGERSWIRTDASIPGTMTGGGVYDQTGRLIGVPTTSPVTTPGDDSSCIPMQDTNADGIVNRADDCVPVGGFINVLRPSAFIRPLLRAASLGLTVERLSSPPLQAQLDGEPAFSRLMISTSVTEGMPTSIVRSLPTGISSLYLFFDYTNMTPETIYELRVTINNLPSPDFSLAPVRWSGGTNGLWHIGSSGRVWPNGTYEFTLFVNGQSSGSISVLIGANQQAAQFSDITFGLEDGDTFSGVGNILPTGNIVSARFVHRNVPDGTPWSRIWYYNGAEISRVDEEWIDSGQDTRVTRIQDDNGLPPGRYRLELYLDGRLAATSDFVIAGAREGVLPRVFRNMRFVSADSAQQAVTRTATSRFPGNIRNVYVLFDWEQLAPGTLWRMRWSVDGTVFYEQTVPWNNDINGQNYVTQLTGAAGNIPDGSYRLELFVGAEEVRLASMEMEVGIGQLPIDSFAQAVGVQFNGQIVDADTGQGIPGVSFILISPDYSLVSFAWRRDQIYALATSDHDGRFQLDRLLEFGTVYSFMISAKGYLPVTSTQLVNEETENPLEVVYALTRD